MKKAVFALTAILSIICLVGATAQVPIALSQIPAPAIQIISPSPSFLRIYQNTTLPLSIEVRLLNNSPEITSISYSLDDKSNITLTNFSKSEEVFFGTNIQGYALVANSTLTNLSEGNHTLNAYAFYTNGEVMSTQEIFKIDSSYSLPIITVLSPLNQTYSSNEIPLTYTVNGEIMWAGYALDRLGLNHSNVNVTLTQLSEGSHKILISLTTTDYAYASQTIYFNVDTSQTSGITLNQTSIIVIATVAIIVAALVLVILYKRKNLKATDLVKKV